jgi:hypothetical protein
LGQHERSGKHQANGNPFTQSSKIRPPSADDGASTRAIALNYFLSRVRNTTNPTIQQNVEIVVRNISLSEGGLVMFGWAKRVTLKHPGFSPAMTEFINWIFYRGNEKGFTKTCAGAMLSHAVNFGLPSVLFADEPYWSAAVERSGGHRIFSEAEIPEEWQVKQYICQLSTSVKQKQRATAGVQPLSPEEKHSHLTSHLSKVGGLTMDPACLATLILNEGKDLSILFQKDIKDIVREGNISTVCKRGIIEACKKVGRELPTSLDLPAATATAGATATTSSASVADDCDDDDDRQIEEEHLAQDMFDWENSNDDVDQE